MLSSLFVSYRSYVLILFSLVLIILKCNGDNNNEMIVSDPILHSMISSSIQTTINKNNNGMIHGGIIWRDLSVSIQKSFNNNDEINIDNDDNNNDDDNDIHHHERHYIVHPCSGILLNGQVCGIIGPSGSGKTSFLSAIAGLIPMDGSVYQYNMDATVINNNNITMILEKKYHDQKKHNNIVSIQRILSNQIAWLQQHDDFFTQLTVRETLQFASFFELPHLSTKQRNILIQKTVDSLGLSKTLDRVIGEYNSESTQSTVTFTKIKKNKKMNRWSSFVNEKLSTLLHSNAKKNTKGTPSSSGNSGGRLSGGERRRLSFAIELLTNKQTLFIADEPTSGLDSRMSMNVMNLIHQVARERNIPIFCSLHQPNSIIYQNLDMILLLAPGGYVCYYGSKDNVISHFTELGYVIPPNTNPAEFLIDLVSIDSEYPNQAQIDLQRIKSLVKSFQIYQKQLIDNNIRNNNKVNENLKIITPSRHSQNSMFRTSQHNMKTQPIINWILQLGALLKRSIRQNTRNIQLNLLRLVLHVGNGLLLSGIFPTVSRGSIPLVNSIADRVALLSFSAVNLGMMSYLETVTIFSKEKPIIQREQRKKQYSSIQYLLSKMIAELPINCLFSLALTTVLKLSTGLQIPYTKLMYTFAMMTTSSASLGFLLGSIAPTAMNQDQQGTASTIGIPIIVILMVVGVINPSGVDPNRPPPRIVQLLKRISPFAYSIEALCLGEYPGVIFQMNDPSSTNQHSRFRPGWFQRVQNMKRMGGLALINTGDQVIEALGLQNQTFYNALRHLGWISMCNFLLSWFFLEWQQHKAMIYRRGGRGGDDNKSQNNDNDRLKSSRNNNNEMNMIKNDDTTSSVTSSTTSGTTPIKIPIRTRL